MLIYSIITRILPNKDRTCAVRVTQYYDTDK